jgi:Flp pilus assembly protein TadD
MIPTRRFWSIFLAAGAIGLVTVTSTVSLHAQEILQDVQTIIMEGKVVMPDGSPPPKSVGIERVCSDTNGDAPGPTTDKKGHYTWTQKLSPAVQRSCYMQATMTGFTSSRFQLGDMKLADFTAGTKQLSIPDLVLSPKDNGAANNVALVDPSDVPGKARDAYKLASKALDSDNAVEGMRQLKIVVAAAPKFADGWTNLGSVYERQGMLTDAKDALQHAIEVNPKDPAPYLRLARVANKLGDWDTAAKSEDSLLAIDKRFYPDIYLHQAITRFEKKDLAGAEESIKTLQSMDPAHKQLRAEYVIGRIELAKGDLPAAKEHIENYIKLDAAAPDISKIQALLESLGAGVAPTSLPLERP